MSRDRHRVTPPGSRIAAPGPLWRAGRPPSPEVTAINPAIQA